jgi:hypothetical protein
MLKGRTFASKRPSLYHTLRTIALTQALNFFKMVQSFNRPIAFALPHICEQFPHPQGPLSPKNPAYVYIAVILESLGKESHVGDVWFYLAERFANEDDQIVLARRLREGLFKASVLVGFPRVCYKSGSGMLYELTNLRVSTA